MSRLSYRRLSSLVAVRAPAPQDPAACMLRTLECLESRTLLATVYTVDLTSDSGASTSPTSGDLRYVIGLANANTSVAGSLIQFDSTVFSTPQVITLGSSLTLSETPGAEAIAGPGASLVTIDGHFTGSVFIVNAGVTASLSGLTITDGVATNGAGINNSGNLTVSDATILHNLAGESGGGIYNAGTLTLTGSTLTQNQAADGAGIYPGPVVFS